MDYKTLAEAAIERRSRLVERRSGVSADRSLKADERRARLAEIDSEIEAAGVEARGYLEAAERDDENRSIVQRAGALGGHRVEDRSTPAEGEWRALLPSRDEARALLEGTPGDGGYTVPSGVAAKYVDLLRANSVFLKGIPAENVIRWTSGKDWSMPVLAASSGPGLVDEGAEITEGDDTFDEIDFQSKKYADLRTASNEILADSALNLRQVVAQTMTRNCAAKVDADAFNGSGSVINGLVPQGTATAATGSTGATASHDDIADAIVRLWQGNANPTVIWAAPDSAGALLKEREGANGAYLNTSDNAASLALTLPILPSLNVPAGRVVVADGSRVFYGVREDVRVAVSEDAFFTSDKVAFRLTLRAAGIYVVEATSVQVITPAA